MCCALVDYPNLEVVIIDDSQQPLVASPTALPAPSAGLQPPVGAIHDPVTALRGLLLGDAATASEHVAAAEYTELANAPAGSARTFRYYHFDRQMAIGEKRNQAASRANGVVVVTWDDDDLFRTHRITKQVEPVLAGHCEITTLAHGLYMYASSQRYFNWSLSSPAERSPHFGTLAYATAMWRSGVHCTCVRGCGCVCVCVRGCVAVWHGHWLTHAGCGRQTLAPASARTTASLNVRWTLDTACGRWTTSTARSCTCGTGRRGQVIPAHRLQATRGRSARSCSRPCCAT